MENQLLPRIKCLPPRNGTTAYGHGSLEISAGYAMSGSISRESFPDCGKHDADEGRGL